MTDERDEDDNVIKLPVRRAVIKHDAHGTQLPIVGELDRDQCAHVQTEISRPGSKTQRFTCKACKAEIDPYVWIWEFARADRHAYYGVNSLKPEVARLEKRVEELKRELASLNGKVKRRRPTGGTLSESMAIALYHLANGRAGDTAVRGRSEHGAYKSNTKPALYTRGYIDEQGEITELGRAALAAEVERRKGGDDGNG